MSEDTTSAGRWSEEDHEVVAAVDRLAAGEETEPGDREVVEALAALPWALEEKPPSPRLKGRLLARVSSVSPRRAAPRVPAWTLPLAASLAVALLALSGWQQVMLTRQGRQLDQLAAAGVAAGTEAPPLADEVERQRRLLAMLTAEGTEFCLLKPVGNEPAFPEARGTLVVAPDRGSWYLRLRGLEPAAGEAAYRVWFHTDEGPRPGPFFDVSWPGQEIELEDGAAPRGLRAISVTEETDRAGTAPEGRRILFADQAMTLL